MVKGSPNREREEQFFAQLLEMHRALRKTVMLPPHARDNKICPLCWRSIESYEIIWWGPCPGTKEWSRHTKLRTQTPMNPLVVVKPKARNLS